VVRFGNIQKCSSNYKNKTYTALVGLWGLWGMSPTKNRFHGIGDL
jgi:hypothetical protein